MNEMMELWRRDKLKAIWRGLWLLTVFFCFFGTSILRVRVPGFCTLYPFRALLPITTLLYLIWTIREKRNPWKCATFAQRVCYILSVTLMIYGAISLRWALDSAFSFTLWITMCFDLVYFSLMLDLCSDRKLFEDTIHCGLLGLLIQIVMGIIEVFSSGILNPMYDFAEATFMFFNHMCQPPVVATGNMNDYSMGLIFMLAMLLVYWTWRRGMRNLDWMVAAAIPPIFFLLCAANARLCLGAFVILFAAFAGYTLVLGKKKYWMLALSIILIGFVLFADSYHNLVDKLNIKVAEQMVQVVEKPVSADSATYEVKLIADTESVELRKLYHNMSVFVPDEDTMKMQSLRSNEGMYVAAEEPVKLQNLSSNKSIFVVDEETGERQLNMTSSGGIRLGLLIHTWNCFKNSRGLGVGLGNTPQLAKLTAEKTGGKWAIHCFLARMSADFGVFFLIPLVLIVIKLLQFGIEQIGRGMKCRSKEIAMAGVVYIAALLSYPIASTAAGDAQESLPMWLFLASMVLFPVHIRKTEYRDGE